MLDLLVSAGLPIVSASRSEAALGVLWCVHRMRCGATARERVRRRFAGKHTPTMVSWSSLHRLKIERVLERASTTCQRNAVQGQRCTHRVGCRPIGCTHSSMCTPSQGSPRAWPVRVSCRRGSASVKEPAQTAWHGGAVLLLSRPRQAHLGWVVVQSGARTARWVHDPRAACERGRFGYHIDEGARAQNPGKRAHLRRV